MLHVSGVAPLQGWQPGWQWPQQQQQQQHHRHHHMQQPEQYQQHQQQTLAQQQQQQQQQQYQAQQPSEQQQQQQPAGVSVELFQIEQRMAELREQLDTLSISAAKKHALKKELAMANARRIREERRLKQLASQ